MVVKGEAAGETAEARTVGILHPTLTQQEVRRELSVIGDVVSIEERSVGTYGCHGWSPYERRKLYSSRSAQNATLRNAHGWWWSRGNRTIVWRVECFRSAGKLTQS